MRTKLYNIFKEQPFLCFVLIHFMVWSILPMFRTGAPMDSLEAIWWGKSCIWGTNKHPPLSGFPAYGLYLLMAESVKSLYILSQICIAVGFLYLYRLAKLMLNADKAVLSVMLMEGVIYYGYVSPEYNVNVLSLAIWPMSAYYFYKAITDNKWADWLLVGFICGLNFLNKYVSGLQMVGIALYLLLFKDGRVFLKTLKPYAAGLLFLCVIAPHIYWLYLHNFVPFEYFEGRGGVDVAGTSLLIKLLNHIVSPVKLLVSLIFYAAGSIIIFFSFNHHLKRTEIKTVDRNFLFCLGVLPLLLILLIGFISGQHIKSMWGFPVLYLLGIILFKYFDYPLTEEKFVKIEKSVYALMGAFAIAYISVLSFSTSPKYNLNGDNFANQYTEVWQKQMKRPLKYVIGDTWLTSVMAIHSKDKPIPVVLGKAYRNPWVSEDDFIKQGGLILAESEGEYNSYVEGYSGKVSASQEIDLEFTNILGKVRRKKLYYGFYEGDKND